MLSNWKFYRRLKGGKWELWFVDVPVNAWVWHQVDELTRVKQDKIRLSASYQEVLACKPSPLCIGMADQIEDWT